MWWGRTLRPNTCCIALMEFEGEGDRGPPLRVLHWRSHMEKGAALQNPRSERDTRQHHLCRSEISSLRAPDFFFFFFLSAELHSSVMTPWARKQGLQTVAEIRKTRRSWVPGTMVCMLISLSYELFPFNPVSKDDFLHMQLIPHITTRNCIF